MENNKKGSRRARLPNYCRSAYKIFFEEKRAEIVNLRLRACDESFERQQNQVQVESIMSFSQCTFCYYCNRSFPTVDHDTCLQTCAVSIFSLYVFCVVHAD
jgi:hypothetical protein